MMMQTPMPVQLEHWIQIVNNKKAPYELRQNAILHLTNIRDTIDKYLQIQKRSGKHENMFTR
jgi:hypothetical protein